MKRKYNLRKIVSKRSYTTEEIAELLEVHTQTIRVWRKEGLKPIEASSSPFLFLGGDVKDFLKSELSKQKTPLKVNECYCLKCRKAVLPINPQVIDRKIKLGNGNDSAFLTGNCPECNSTLRRFTSLEIQKDIKQEVNQKETRPLEVSQNKKDNTTIGQMSLFSFDGEK